MRTLGTAALVAAVTTLAGCGSSGSPEASAPDDCTGHGRVVARADLDGDGKDAPVRLTTQGSGACAHRLMGDAGTSADLKGLDLAAKGARVVHLDGHRGDLLLVSSEPHPRGGAQPHLFGRGGASGLRELTVDGQPLVPFVATDGGAPPMTATCTDKGEIAIDTAKAHQPPGIVLAWDVTRTTYAIKGGVATRARSRLVAAAAADPTLRKDRPDLFDGRLFAGCS